jgi:glyceraldehyde 3-phosphate dehydrogenase
MKKIRVAINGFGRIGRAFLKVVTQKAENSDIEIVAINDLGDINNFAYLLRHDTAYRDFKADIKVSDDKSTLIVNGQEIKFIGEKDPTKLPWRDLNIDIVVECTGLFTSGEKAKAHIDAGAKRVVVSAPTKDEPESVLKSTMVLMRMNEDDLSKSVVTSNASCTTNAVGPILAILDESLGIEKALLNTTHAYTASQAIVDGPNRKDFREGRAGAMNLAPSSTGAATALTKIMKNMEGLFDGISVRVPVVTGSLVDLTFISKKETSTEEVNKILIEASKTDRWKGIFAVTDEPLVSSDIIGNPHASIADLQMTRVVGGNLVKVLAWYDNEMGYTNTLVEHVEKVGKLV